MLHSTHTHTNDRLWRKSQWANWKQSHEKLIKKNLDGSSIRIVHTSNRSLESEEKRKEEIRSKVSDKMQMRKSKELMRSECVCVYIRKRTALGKNWTYSPAQHSHGLTYKSAHQMHANLTFDSWMAQENDDDSQEACVTLDSFVHSSVRINERN